MVGFRTLGACLLVWAACATADPDNGGGDPSAVDASNIAPTTDARPLPDAPIGTPDAKPPPIDAAPGTPDAAPQAAQCTQETTLECNQAPLEHALFFADADINGYSCEQFDTTGVENIYLFSPPTTGQVTVTLDVLEDDPFFGDDFDLYVMESTCNVTSCVAQSAGTGDEQLTFSATGGQTYFVAVEAFAVGFLTFMDYDLSVSCP